MTGLRRELALAAFFLVASGFVLRPLPLHLDDTIPAGTDPQHHVYILSWLLDHGLSGDRFEGRMFHPARNAVLRSDLSLGTVVLMAPLAPFVHDPLTRLNLATWFALAFSGWAFCLLGRLWSGSVSGGLLAGITAVLGCHQSLHYVHLNLLSVGWLPLFLLGLDRVLSGGALRWAAFTGLSFVLVAASSGYYGVAAVVLALVFFARRPSRGALGFGVLAALLAALLLSPYFTAYADLHAEESLSRTSRELAKGSWTLADFGSRSLLHRIWNPAFGEPLFPGFVVLGLAGLALVKGGARERTLGLAFAALFWLGLGEPGGLYRLLAFPPFASMRHPVTLTAVAVMLLSVLAARGLVLWTGDRKAFAAILVALASVETLCPPAAFFGVAPGVPAVYEAALARPEGPILEVPPLSADPLVWAARRGFETLNGGGAFIPAITLRIETAIQNHWLTDTYQAIDDSKAARLLLNETAVRYLILPGGRRGGLDPLAERFKESRCFRLLGDYDADLLYEAVRDENCVAWASEHRVTPSS